MRFIFTLLSFVFFNICIGYASHPIYTIHVEDPGSLAEELSSLTTGLGPEFKIIGPLNNEDFKAFQRYKNDHIWLDLSEAQVQEIPESAFLGSTIHKVILPPTLVTIKRSAFAGCEYLQEVDFSRCTELQAIGGVAFTMSKLTSVDLGNCTKLKYLGGIDESDGPFSQCSKLENVILPPNLELITDLTFSSANFTYLDIPKSVKEIGNSAFAVGGYMEEIKMNSATPPKTRSKSPFNERSLHATLKVPSGSLLKYKSVEFWKDFEHIEEYNPNGGELVIHTVSIFHDTGGAVKINGQYIGLEESLSVTDQTDIQLLIEPGVGYHLEQILINGIDRTNDAIDNLLVLPSVSSNQDISITFEVNSYTLDVSYNEEGGYVKLNNEKIENNTSVLVEQTKRVIHYHSF